MEALSNFASRSVEMGVFDDVLVFWRQITGRLCAWVSGWVHGENVELLGSLNWKKKLD